MSADPLGGKVTAPWSDDQVQSLNRFQQHSGMHPFTCPRDHGAEAVLKAYPAGWGCNARDAQGAPCQYQQDWAHGFMADWSWCSQWHWAAEIAKLRSGAETLGNVITHMARSMEAARIEMLQNGPTAAMEWILQAIPDVSDDEPEDQWDGKETAAEWLGRTAEPGAAVISGG